MGVWTGSAVGEGLTYCVCAYRVSECVDVHVFIGVYSNAEREVKSAVLHR